MILIALALLYPVTLLAGPDLYSISGLANGSREEAGESTSNIGPLEGSSLAHLPAPAPDRRNLQLRRRSEKAKPDSSGEVFEYRLYSGKVKDCFAGLDAFRLPDLDYNQRLHRKFYSVSGSNFYGDIPEVYYQGDYVLVPRTEALYFKQRGEWKEILREASMPGCLELKSEPAMATVVLDGDTIGPTPQFVTGVAAGPVRINLLLEGHAPVATEIFIGSRKVARPVPFRLLRLPTAEERSRGHVDTKALLTAPYQGPAELKERVGLIEDALKTRARIRDSLAQVFDAAYPEFPERGGTEEESRRHERKALYAREKAQQKQVRLAGLDSSMQGYRQALDTLEGRVRKLECSIFLQDFPGAAADLAYNRQYKYSTFSLAVRKEPFRFLYQGEIDQTAKEAGEMESKRGALRLQLEYRKVMRQGKDGRDYYVALDTLKVFLGNREIPSKGGFVPDSGLISEKDFAALRMQGRACNAVPHIHPPKTTWKWWALGAAGAAAAGAGGYFLTSMGAPGKNPGTEEFVVDIKFKEEP